MTCAFAECAVHPVWFISSIGAGQMPTCFLLRHKPKHVQQALKQPTDIRFSSRLCQGTACFILLLKCRPTLQNAHSSSDKLSSERAKTEKICLGYISYLSFIHELVQFYQFRSSGLRCLDVSLDLIMDGVNLLCKVHCLDLRLSFA